MDVSLGQWTPDRSGPIMAPDLLQALNVYPRVNGYSPFPNFMQGAAGSLGSACKGAISGINAAQLPFVIALDGAHLWGVLGSGTLASLAALSPAATSQAQYARYGDLVIETHFDDPPQQIDASPGGAFTVSALSADASFARAVGVVQRFVVLGNLVGRGVNAGAIGTAPQGVHWCAFLIPTSWPQIGTLAARSALSDFQPLKSEYGNVQYIIGGKDYGTVLQERAVTRMQYTGYDTVFQFVPVDTSRGCLIPGSVVNYGNFSAWQSQDGFQMFDGNEVRPIGFERIDAFVQQDMDNSYFYRWSTAMDPRQGFIAWAYPGAGNTAGMPNRLLLYQWKLDKWTLVNVQVEALVSLATLGTSLDQLTANLDTAGIANLDTWAQAQLSLPPTLSGFDPTHTLGSFNGSPMNGTIETGAAELAAANFGEMYQKGYPPGGGFVTTVHGVRPVVEYSDITAKLNVSVSGRLSPLDPVVYGPSSTPNANGVCGQRTTGRYMRAMITTQGAFGILSGLDIIMQQRGRR